jgi:hypothetical protein
MKNTKAAKPMAISSEILRDPVNAARAANDPERQSRESVIVALDAPRGCIIRPSR